MISLAAQEGQLCRASFDDGATSLESLPMTLLVVGSSFKTSTISTREEIARKITIEKLVEMQREREEFVGTELALLSTCNRVEFYCYCRKPDKVVVSLSTMLTGASQSKEFQPFCLSGKDALSHLFSVAAGLDSLVLGDAQIVSQIKEALVKASGYSLSGPMLSNILHKAIEVGIEARRSSPVYSIESKRSVGHSITKFLEKYLDENSWQKLDKKHHPKPNILVVGSGKMATLAIRSLDREKVGKIIVASRKPTRRNLDVNGQIDILDIDREIRNIDFDIIISAVSSERFILLPEHFSFLSDAKYIHKSILIIDISFPRSVDPLVGNLNNITLYNLDNFANDQLFDKIGNSKVDSSYVPTAERLIHLRANEQIQTIREINSGVISTLSLLYRKAEEIRSDEFANALSRIADISMEQEGILDLMTKRIVRRLLHDPAERLKGIGRKESIELAEKYSEALKDLFSLNNSSSSR